MMHAAQIGGSEALILRRVVDQPLRRLVETLRFHHRHFADQADAEKVAQHPAL